LNFPQTQTQYGSGTTGTRLLDPEEIEHEVEEEMNEMRDTLALISERKLKPTSVVSSTKRSESIVKLTYDLPGKSQEPKSTKARDQDQGYSLCNSSFYSPCCIATFAVFSAISISAIVIGALFFGTSNCPAEPNMASVLIFTGAFGILILIAVAATFYQLGKPESPERKPFLMDDPASYLAYHAARSKRTRSNHRYMNVVVILMGVEVLVFIYLATILWDLYPNQSNNNGLIQVNDSDTKYCNEILFIFTLVLTIVILTLSTIALVAYCTIGCFFSYMRWSKMNS